MAVVALLLLTGCSAASCSTADAVDPSTPAASSASAEPGSCGWRHVNPEEPIPGELFASCVIDATILAGTAMLESTSSAGVNASGPVTFRPPISVHLTGDPSGIEAIIIGEEGWLSAPGGGGWVRADPNGNPSEQMAHTTVMMYTATADPEVLRDLLATAEEWTPTAVEVIDGLSVQGYAGTPVQEGVVYDEFTVWITDEDLPLRYDQSGTGHGGYAFTSQLSFSDYGEPVEILPPGDTT